MTAAARPRFSIVSAVYNVEPYLPELIASVEAQALDAGAVEVIAVDDGSTDGSLRILETWRGRTTIPVTIVTQANAGQGAARNAGLDLATGEWVTFTDPDDMLGAGYLAAADAFARGHPSVDVLAAKRVMFREALGEDRDTHPRRWQFAGGSRVADLELEPNVFPGSATNAFFRTDRLRRAGVRFDPDLRPHFEDQHFPARFLLELDRPLVGLVADAAYRYRVRLANDSTMQRAHQDPRAYTTVFEHGYLDLVRRSRDRSGTVVPWVQQVLLYEVFRLYFREADRIPSRLAIPDSVAERFLELLGELARALDPEQVYAHATTRVEAIWAEVLVHGFRNERWVPSTVDRTAVDRRMGLQRIAYRYRGEAPVERFEAGDAAVEPPFAKRRAVRYFGQTELEERIAWVPARSDLRLTLDGTPMTIGAPRAPVRAVETRRARHAGSAPRRGIRGRIAALLDATVRRRRFRDAWVVMDAVGAAGGEGERLFEHLRAQRRDINAWFVVRDGTPDWRRLRRAGERRVVAYGGAGWRSLMEQAAWLVSSDADPRIHRPHTLVDRGVQPPWSSALVGRGAAGPDVAPALDTLPIGMVAVGTEAELDELAGDDTRSGLTRKEVRLTGFPTDEGGSEAVVAALEALSRPWRGPGAKGRP